MAYLLGIDVGTSAVKCVLLDAARAVGGGDPARVVSSSVELSISRPRAGWSEQAPEEWWRASVGAIRGVLMAAGIDGGAVVGVGLSGQMHGSVLMGSVGEDGRDDALRPAILWNDQRTGAECEEIERSVEEREDAQARGLCHPQPKTKTEAQAGSLCHGKRMVELVGNRALTGFTLPKVLWVRKHEPGVFARTKRVLLPKDFIRYRLTGVAATDVGDASGTLLFDVVKRAWSAAMFEAVGLERSLAPEVHESCAIAGRLTEWAAGMTGLRAGTPVAAGSGDNMAGAIGAGVSEAGMVGATIGTSGVVYAHSDRPRLDVGSEGVRAGRVHTMCAADGTATRAGAWCNTGCMLSAGGALAWARGVLAPDVSFAELDAEAARIPPGCEGLVFLPYLTGERCPHADPNARGAWVGLTMRHTRGHLYRAVMEGVCFGMAQMMGLMRSIGVGIGRARLGGGGAKSALWRQMQADVYGVPCELVGGDEGPALGAAIMAGVGVGTWPSVSAACREVVRVSETVEPSREAGAYGAARGVYDKLYGDLRERFGEMGW